MAQNIQTLTIFNPDSFNRTWDMANQFVGTKSTPNTLLPKAYQGEPGAFLIALDIANDPNDPQRVLTVMQNLDIIQGKPSWSSTYVIAKLNSSNKFPDGVDFEMKDLGEIEVEYEDWGDVKGQRVKKKLKVQNRSCYAYATNRSGKLIKGATIDMVMAVKEGWYQKNGSKWQTMPEQMLMYRAATFFARVHAPEVLHGFKTVDEVIDIESSDTLAITSAPSKEKAKATPGGLLAKANAAVSDTPKASNTDEKTIDVTVIDESSNQQSQTNVTPKNDEKSKSLPQKLLAYLESQGLTRDEAGEFVKQGLKITSNDVDQIQLLLANTEVIDIKLQEFIAQKK